MKKNVQVLLLEDVEGVGQAGSIVSVSEGYARNALFPGGRAALATDRVQEQAAATRNKSKAEQEKEIARLRKIAEKLDSSRLELKAKIKDGTEIFGSITAKHIAEALHAQASLDVKPKQVRLQTPITEIGSYDVVIALSADVECAIQLEVEPDEEARRKNEDEE